MLGTAIMNGESTLLVSHWVDDYGYTFVSDKADYMTYDYYVQKKNKVYKLNKSSSAFSNQHANLIKQLMKIYPNCDTTDINQDERKIEYDDLPELIEMVNNSCVGTN